MLCLRGFELYSRWVPLSNLCLILPRGNGKRGLLYLVLSSTSRKAMIKGMKYLLQALQCKIIN